MSKQCCAPDAPARPSVEHAEAAPKPARPLCPACKQPGRPVDTLTVKALLRLPLTEIRAVAYSFCRTAECPVVYFTADGQQQFTEDMLREPVHQKHPASDHVPVCYCFQHTPGSIRAEACATGRSTAVQRITAGIQAGQCACEIRNPQGSCCLGNVRAVVKRLEAECAAAVAARAPAAAVPAVANERGILTP